MKRILTCRWLVAVLAASGGCQLAMASAMALPATQHVGPVTFVSGGVGLDESQALKEAMHNYPLVLEFAGRTSDGNKYLADVPVRIFDAHGKAILETSARGPFLLVSLPAGRYTVAASYGEKTEQRSVNVLPNGHVHQLFLWQM
ncbi:carboxypeptidase regulatory-like domain-containing protein [Cupriavidus pinatubonensis]|uniref:Carboxypeptidase regulatory-like domain-containing protein n=1 Tax=Cupriavidus pinatubonensis TaxID=248026 RepID=A0ABM8XKR8_9BURK|nr:carboxypeptidase regulatory-like domain-containing protein [Cupriavidus pinatubonensis]CAG9180799.1 hypothetical protein LMG23994_04496 [Cupriavidus pinatubonensis]